MFKKTMTFDDLDGNEVTKTFYFNYNKKEVAELLEFGEVLKFSDGKEHLPLEEQIKLLQTPIEVSGLSQVENNKQAYAIFQHLLLNAYGEKGADNVTFVKNQKLRDFWESHVAFTELVFEMLDDTRLFNDFMEKCLPPKMVNAAKDELAKQGKTLESAVTEELNAPVAPTADAEDTDISDEELLKLNPTEMTKAQLVRAMHLRLNED